MAILTDNVVSLEGHLPEKRTAFKLVASAKMFNILSDGIYSNKIAAVIRELSCNAYDAHVAAGQTKPFHITVPSNLEPIFSVEDYGTGIDPAKMADVFWTFGASTKSGTNDQIGALGLGCKSPFAYSKSSFNVRNRYNGREYHYFCFINQEGTPDGALVGEAETTEPNGLQVTLAVKFEDISTFCTEIKQLFSFWPKAKLPKLSDSQMYEELLTAKPSLEGQGWYLAKNRNHYNTPVAVMGGVPYPIRFKNIPNINYTNAKVHALARSPIVLEFPIGSLSFQVSREELSYDEPTCEALLNQLKVVHEAIFSKLTTVADGKKNAVEFAIALNDAKHAARMLDISNLEAELNNHKYTLADGRMIHANWPRTRELKGTGTVGYCVYTMESTRVVYNKGVQRNHLIPITSYNLERFDKDGRKFKRNRDWFPASTEPKPHTNPARKPTAANLLHEGYKPVSWYAELNSFGLATRLIINDIGKDGIEGIRFYAYNLDDAGTYFIDGSSTNMDPQDLYNMALEWTKGTMAEGVVPVFLSKMKDFKLPVAPAKAPAAKVTHPKNTTEVKLQKFTVHKQMRGHASTRDMTYMFPLISGSGFGDYRVTHGETLYYVQTDFGRPTDARFREDNNILRNTKFLAALIAAGDLMPVNDELTIALIPTGSMDEMKKKFKLVNVIEIIDNLQKEYDANTTLHDVVKFQPGLRLCINRDIVQGASVAAAQTTGDKLSYQSPFHKAVFAGEHKRNYFVKNPRDVIQMFFVESGIFKSSFLSAEFDHDKFFDQYPLLRFIGNQHVAKADVPMILEYVIMNDIKAGIF